MHRPTVNRWLSQAEAGEYLGVTARTIRQYIRNGALTGRRLPGSRIVRVDREEIDRVLGTIPSAKIDKVPTGGDDRAA